MRTVAMRITRRELSTPDSEREPELPRLALRASFCAQCASWMTGTVFGDPR
jgi:hypothetical protein